MRCWLVTNKWEEITLQIVFAQGRRVSSFHCHLIRLCRSRHHRVEFETDQSGASQSVDAEGIKVAKPVLEALRQTFQWPWNDLVNQWLRESSSTLLLVPNDLNVLPFCSELK